MDMKKVKFIQMKDGTKNDYLLLEKHEKKFINVKLYGEKPSVANAPSKKGAKNITKNLLLT